MNRYKVQGFTLLELMVVVTVIAIGTAGVGLALRDGAQGRVEIDAQRLAVVLELARAQALLKRRTVDVEVRNNGIVVHDASQKEVKTWLDVDTLVKSTSSEPKLITISAEPFIAPDEVFLTSRANPEIAIRVASDGVGPFVVGGRR